MSFLLKGKITNSTGALSAHTIKAFDKEPWPGSIDDDYIGSAVSLDDGTFRLQFSKEQFKKPLEVWDDETNPDLYFKIEDPSGNDITDSKDLSLDTDFTELEIPQADKFEVVVIGSGFGGTIISVSWVNRFTKEYADEVLLNPNVAKKKVCILERGQWWLSHEVPISRGFNEVRNADPTQHKPGIREYLEENEIPYRTWPYPDNFNGLTELVNATRLKDRRGLYDYRAFTRVHTIAASGVGGGSLIYTNVTEEPDPEVVNDWDTKLHLGINYNNLKPYFDMARAFIGVNKITTTTGLGTFKLARAKIFQDAAEKLRAQLPSGVIRNPPSPVTGPYDDVYATDLSITDIPQDKDLKSVFQTAGLDFETVKNKIKGGTEPQYPEVLAQLFRKYSAEPNICERQGRCAIGCIPGARHTNNKKLFDILKDGKKKDHLEVRVLSEAVDIEPLNDPDYKYRIHYTDYSARDIKQKSFSWTDNQTGNSYQLSIKLFRWSKNPKRPHVDCKKLFLAAGALGSTEILIKAANTRRPTGQKLILSDMIGKQYSTNGDLLGVVSRTKEDVAMTRGPIVTSHIRFNEGSGFIYTIEDSGLPKMFSGISKLLADGGLLKTALNFAGMGRIDDLRNTITQNFPSPLPNPNVPIQIAEQDLSHTMLFSGMGTDNSDGVINVKDDWKNNPDRDMDDIGVINVEYDLNLLQPLFTKIRNSMGKLATHIGDNKNDTSFDTPLWDPTNPNKSSTVVLHNLGGCCMGADRSKGVVNSFGIVYKGQGSTPAETYNELYVVDGGIIPTSLGINSSLTISALAFRIAEQVIGQNFLPIEKVILTGAQTVYLPKDPSL